MSESFQSRWGVSIADDTGYLNTPGFILRNYHKFVDKDGNQVGLDLGEFAFMSHIMSFKYDTANGKATPSLSTVAKRMGVELRSARRIKGRLIDKGALTVIYREGETSIYEFSGLAKQCLKYALEEGEDIMAPSDTAVRGGRAEKSEGGGTERSEEVGRNGPPKNKKEEGEVEEGEVKSSTGAPTGRAHQRATPPAQANCTSGALQSLSAEVSTAEAREKSNLEMRIRDKFDSYPTPGAMYWLARAEDQNKNNGERVRQPTPIERYENDADYREYANGQIDFWGDKAMREGGDTTDHIIRLGKSLHFMDGKYGYYNWLKGHKKPLPASEDEPEVIGWEV